LQFLQGYEIVGTRSQTKELDFLIEKEGKVNYYRAENEMEALRQLRGNPNLDAVVFDQSKGDSCIACGNKGIRGNILDAFPEGKKAKVDGYFAVYVPGLQAWTVLARLMEVFGYCSYGRPPRNRVTRDGPYTSSVARK
jgi:hypothetical protein